MARTRSVALGLFVLSVAVLSAQAASGPAQDIVVNALKHAPGCDQLSEAQVVVLNKNPDVHYKVKVEGRIQNDPDSTSGFVPSLCTPAGGPPPTFSCSDDFEKEATLTPFGTVNSCTKPVPGAEDPVGLPEVPNCTNCDQCDNRVPGLEGICGQFYEATCFTEDEWCIEYEELAVTIIAHSEDGVNWTDYEEPIEVCSVGGETECPQETTCHGNTVSKGSCEDLVASTVAEDLIVSAITKRPGCDLDPGRVVVKNSNPNIHVKVRVEGAVQNDTQANWPPPAVCSPSGTPCVTEFSKESTLNPCVFNSTTDGSCALPLPGSPTVSVPNCTGETCSQSCPGCNSCANIMAGSEYCEATCNTEQEWCLEYAPLIVSVIAFSLDGTNWTDTDPHKVCTVGGSFFDTPCPQQSNCNGGTVVMQECANYKKMCY